MSEVQEQKRIKRSRFATFLNVGTSAAPNYARFGKGVEEQKINYNPETESTKYIHEDSATTEVSGYAPAYDTTQKTYENEPIFEYMYEKMRLRAIGDQAKSDDLKVYMFKKLAEGIYEAEKCNVIVTITEFDGAEIGYTVNENGDPISGYVTITNGAVTFTEGEYTA